MTPANTFVLHAGALGDGVLVWPLLRALDRAGRRVAFVAPDAKARLAAAHLSVRPISIERPLFTRLWRGEHGLGPGDADPLITLVITFLGEPAADNAPWWNAARAAWPHAEIMPGGPPASPTRAALWTRFNVGALGHPAPRTPATGPVVIHLGAGSQSKRWPIERWSALARALSKRGHSVRALVGEVEFDRFSPAECGAADALRAVSPPTLEHLAAAIASARLYIGADTGPTHLAAQLGVPTLALFGPTDPQVWSPVGPLVRVLAPPAPSPMSWLAPQAVLAEADRMLSGSMT